VGDPHGGHSYVVNVRYDVIELGHYASGGGSFVGVPANVG
jgi:hypothetical protein